MRELNFSGVDSISEQGRERCRETIIRLLHTVDPKPTEQIPVVLMGMYLVPALYDMLARDATYELINLWKGVLHGR